jgi:RNA polymerase sigma factor (sigma-70 family)
LQLNVSQLDPDERLQGLLRLYPHALAHLLHPHPHRLSSNRSRRTGDAKRSMEEWLSVKLEVEGLLSRLPDRERWAVTLYYLTGYAQREAALTLGVSQPRLAAILARARRRLVRRLTCASGSDG